MTTITINKDLLAEQIKEAINGVLNPSTTNTFGGSNEVQSAIDLMEGFDWTIDQVNGNMIYAHLNEEPSLEVVVEVTTIDGKVKEVHWKGDEFDTGWCIDLKYLIDKLAELDF